MSVEFLGLAPLVIEGVADGHGVIRVRARSSGGPVACPDCGTWTARVHGYRERVVADVPLDVLASVTGGAFSSPALPDEVSDGYHAGCQRRHGRRHA